MLLGLVWRSRPTSRAFTSLRGRRNPHDCPRASRNNLNRRITNLCGDRFNFGDPVTKVRMIFLYSINHARRVDRVKSDGCNGKIDDQLSKNTAHCVTAQPHP